MGWTAFVKRLRNTFDYLTVRKQFQLGPTIPDIDTAPTLDFVADTSGSYFNNGDFLAIGFIYYEPNSGQVTDFIVETDLNLSADGVVDIGGFAGLQRKIGDFRLHIVRYSNSLGQPVVLADISDAAAYPTTYRDDNSTYITGWNGRVVYTQTLTPGTLVTSVNGTNPDATTGNVSISASDPNALKTYNNLSDLNNAATARGNLGANNASNLTSGTVVDARLSSNVPLKNQANTFTGIQTFSNDIWVGSTQSLYFNTSNPFYLEPRTTGGQTGSLAFDTTTDATYPTLSFSRDGRIYCNPNRVSALDASALDGTLVFGGRNNVDALLIQNAPTNPGNLITFRNSSNTQIAAVTSAGNASFRHFIGSSPAPTIAAGSAAGTSPTIAISGTDLSGTITLTTGASPVTGTVATITFNAAYGAAPRFTSPAAGNAAASALSGTSKPYYTSTTTTLVLNSGSVALAASTQYIWTYGVSQ